ncbi:unnamed protein product [Lactuca saligna]|uniref:Uncharacterized protein n=1 Tax=Lactuca saligna TaxID=75948 RepID=A0AA36EJL9_LACSI|nr:unnamed protein product [Lactuca saligna]
MMGTELIRHHVKEENMEIPSIPPGFESLIAFSLKRVDNSSQTTKNEPGVNYIDDEDVRKYIKCRPWINHGRTNTTSEDESKQLRYVAGVKDMLDNYFKGEEFPPQYYIVKEASQLHGNANTKQRMETKDEDAELLLSYCTIILNRTHMGYADLTLIS